MGHRLSKIYTRTGDTATTGLGNGDRVAKTDLRVAAYGEIDELNSHLGVLMSHQDASSDIHVRLTDIQHDLFNVGGELSVPGFSIIDANDVKKLEHWIDDWNQHLPPLKNFILPGGCFSSAYCHVVRTVCRRAERAICALHASEPIADVLLAYVNRLSDLFFVLARTLQKAEGLPETLWQRKVER